MKSFFKTCPVVFLISFLCAEQSFAQQKNPTTWPYGGVPDSSRYKDWMKHVPLKFEKAQFDSAHFSGITDFLAAKFDSSANFRRARFDSLADFIGVGFFRNAYFREAHFKDDSHWGGTFFGGIVDFAIAQFDSGAAFDPCIFDNKANFSGADFLSLSSFQSAVFADTADFSVATFQDIADFQYTTFKSFGNFNESEFISFVDFRQATLKKVDFRGTKIDSIVDFSAATLKDTLFFGSQKSDFFQSIPKLDCMRANLLSAGIDLIPADTTKNIPAKRKPYPGAKIILYGPVDLKMQMEKLAFVELCDTLDYFSKKDIITVLKEQSFKDDKSAQFELDYMLAKSTLYQKVSVNYETYSAFHPHVWLQFLYNATMGLGYRPFRLIWWALALIAGFGIFYMFKMSERINQYILKDEKKGKPDGSSPWFGRIVHCLYFSAMVFFTFRLKKDILTFFTNREKRIIVGQWLLGFLIYVAFLTLSKSGSILQNLKDLFVG